MFAGTSLFMRNAAVFGLIQIVAFAQLVRSYVSDQQFKNIVKIGAVVICLVGTIMFGLLTYKGWIAPWTGRFYSLWDTGYAKKYIPIIASVSEHQPTAWPSFFMDLQFLIFLFPAGVVLCFRQLRDEHLFVIIYAVMASYFAGVMVRLMLTLTPVVCVTAAITLSTVLDTYIDPSEPDVADDNGSESTRSNVPGTPVDGTSPAATSKKTKRPALAQTALASAISELTTPATSSINKKSRKGIFGMDTRLVVVSHTLFMLAFFVFHCTWTTSHAYSSPSVVLASSNPDGSQHIIDDFREAYYWLRQNTPKDAVVMSWWDYGYQIAGMADRPTLVDNNTWNNSMSSETIIFANEDKLLTLDTQPISLLSERQWQVVKKLLILFSENMTSTTFSSSLVL